jgi:hypothetical protein
VFCYANTTVLTDEVRESKVEDRNVPPEAKPDPIRFSGDRRQAARRSHWTRLVARTAGNDLDIQEWRRP